MTSIFFKFPCSSPRLPASPRPAPPPPLPRLGPGSVLFNKQDVPGLPGYGVELHQLRAAGHPARGPPTTCCRCTTSASPSPTTWSLPSPSRGTPATTLRPSVTPAQVRHFKCLMLGSLRRNPPRVLRCPPRVLRSPACVLRSPARVLQGPPCLLLFLSGLLVRSSSFFLVRSSSSAVSLYL